MECEDIRKRLEAFVDDDTGAPERAAIEAHLDQCPACRRVVRQVTELRRVLQSWKGEEPPRDLYGRLQSKLNVQRSWWRTVLTPAFVGKAALRLAEVGAIVLITLAVNRHFQKPTVAVQDDLATINLYMTEHQEAVLQSASAESSGRPESRVTLNRDDIMYYEFVDGYRRTSRPGVILRGPGSQPQGAGAASPDSKITGAEPLTLAQARKAVGFDPVAPARVHPGYILDGVMKVAGRDSLHLLYTNGIDTFSVFEQPLNGERGLAAREFREYAVYKGSKAAENPGNQPGTTILAWKNSHVAFVLIGREDMSRLMDIAQAFSNVGKSINEFGD
jgi:hypothetical protein